VQRRLTDLFLGIVCVAGSTMLVGLYTKIFFRIRRREKQMTSLGTATGRGNEKNFLQNVREAWSCFMVAVCTIVCFLPSGIEVFIGELTYSGIVQHRWCSTILSMAPVLNSVVFFWRNKLWRTEARKILCKND
jgi:hypothetical protein